MPMTMMTTMTMMMMMMLEVNEGVDGGNPLTQPVLPPSCLNPLAEPACGDEDRDDDGDDDDGDGDVIIVKR